MHTEHTNAQFAQKKGAHKKEGNVSCGVVLRQQKKHVGYPRRPLAPKCFNLNTKKHTMKITAKFMMYSAKEMPPIFRTAVLSTTYFSVCTLCTM